MSIVKTQTEYTINSLTVTEEHPTSTDGSQVSLFKADQPCKLTLKLDADGNPIGLVVKQVDIPDLIKALNHHVVK